MSDLHLQNCSSDLDRVVIVLTTWPADRDSSALTVPLVEERLAACVNVLSPMLSVYRWNGAVQRESEQQFLIKTTARQLTALHDRVRALHPYEVPEFLIVEVLGGAVGYADWVAQCVSAPAGNTGSES